MKGIFNISKRFRSFFFSMLAILFVFGVSISIAYGEWLFDPEITNTDVDNNDIQPTFNADPIRENTILNDGHDVYDAGTQYYDVYFMAQNVSTSVFLTASGTMNGQTNYVFRTDRTPSYYNDTVDSNGRQVAMAYGTFKEEGSTKGNLGALLSDDYLNQDFNRYFKRFRNVAELTTTQIDQLGTPECFLFDRLSNDNAWNGLWPLNFLCWTPTVVTDLYNNSSKNYYWTSSYDPLILDYASTTRPTDNTGNAQTNYDNYYQYFDGYEGLTNFAQVTGWFPPDNSSSFTTFYTNTVLSNYDSNAIYVNGRKSIFVYPVYTISKNYVNSNVTVDSIKLAHYLETPTTTNTSDHDGFVYDAAYDGALTNTIRQSSGITNTAVANGRRISVYVVNDVVFDEEFLVNNAANENYKLYIRNDIDRYNGGWKGYDNNVVTNCNIYDVGSGRFNIYIIVNETYYNEDYSNFSTADTTNIINAFTSNGYGLYSYMEGNRGYLDYNYRDYIIYFERVYEPRLIAGPTGIVDYESDQSKSAAFIRRGNNNQGLTVTDSRDRYRLRNVRLNNETSITYDLPAYTNNVGGSEHTYKLRLPGNYFGIMVLPEYGFYYNYTIPSSNDITESNGVKYYTNSSLGLTNAILPEMSINNVYNYEFSGDTYFEQYDYTTDDRINPEVYIEEYADGVLQSTKYSIGAFSVLLDDGTIKTFNPDSFVLIKAKESGNYTIEAWMQYEQDATTGRTTLSNIIFWGYRLTSLFVNIVTPEMTALDNFLGYTGYDEQSGLQDNNFINTEIYQYSKHDYSDGAHASGSDVYSDGTSPITLSEILDSHTLRDYVTGKIYTSSTINQLYMDRNYVLILE